MADHVEINYDQMAHIAEACDQQGEEARQMLQVVALQVEDLRAGGWVGQGANAFFAEMDDLVLPALNRLLEALQYAADVVRSVAYQFEEAEQETATLFRGAGVAGGQFGDAVGNYNFKVEIEGVSHKVLPKVEGGALPKVEDGSVLPKVGGNPALGGNQSAKIKGSAAQQVGGDQSFKVGGSPAQQVGGEQSFKVEGSSAQQVGGDQSFKVEGSSASAQVNKFPGPPGDGGGGGGSTPQHVADVGKFPESPSPSVGGDPTANKFAPGTSPSSQANKFTGLDDDVDDISHKV